MNNARTSYTNNKADSILLFRLAVWLSVVSSGASCVTTEVIAIAGKRDMRLLTGDQMKCTITNFFELDQIERNNFQKQKVYSSTYDIRSLVFRMIKTNNSQDIACNEKASEIFTFWSPCLNGEKRFMTNLYILNVDLYSLPLKSTLNSTSWFYQRSGGWATGKRDWGLEICWSH